mmetsp:Transcript_95646/g.309836  ORF Transcript_95646/g.309836 Transcript_95646/m.309836 type:complete len:783 (-) Transcript_95646:232-2580(-)
MGCGVARGLAVETAVATDAAFKPLNRAEKPPGAAEAWGTSAASSSCAGPASASSSHGRGSSGTGSPNWSTKQNVHRSSSGLGLGGSIAPTAASGAWSGAAEAILPAPTPSAYSSTSSSSSSCPAVLAPAGAAAAPPSIGGAGGVEGGGGGGQSASDTRAANYEKRLLAKRGAREKKKGKDKSNKSFNKTFLSHVPEVDADIALHFNFTVMGPAARVVIEAACKSPAAAAMQQGRPLTPMPEMHLLSTSEQDVGSPTVLAPPSWSLAAPYASTSSAAAAASSPSPSPPVTPRKRGSSKLGSPTKLYRCLVPVGSNSLEAEDPSKPADGRRVAKLSFAALSLDEDAPPRFSRLEALSSVVLFALFVDGGATHDPWRHFEEQLEGLDRAVKRMRARSKANLRPVRAVLLCHRTASAFGVGQAREKSERWAAALADFEKSHGYLWKFGPVCTEERGHGHDDAVYAVFAEMAAARTAHLAETEDEDEEEEDGDDAHFHSSTGALEEAGTGESYSSNLQDSAGGGLADGALSMFGGVGGERGGSLARSLSRGQSPSNYGSEASEGFQVPAFDTERSSSKVSVGAFERHQFVYGALEESAHRQMLSSAEGSVAFRYSRSSSSILSTISQPVPSISVHPGGILPGQSVFGHWALLGQPLSGRLLGLPGYTPPQLCERSEGNERLDLLAPPHKLEPPGFTSMESQASFRSGEGSVAFRSNRTGSGTSSQQDFRTEVSLQSADSVASTAPDTSHLQPPMHAFHTEQSGSSVASSAIDLHMRTFGDMHMQPYD